MKIVDMHAHVDVMPAFNWVDTPDKLVALMDEAGIFHAVVSAYSNYPARDDRAVERLCRSLEPYRDRLSPFARMDPGYGGRAVELLENAHRDFGIKGVKLHPTDYTLHPFGDFTVNLVRRAGELGLPVLLHCGDEVMSYPLQIGEMAKRCPDTVIIMAHMGGVFHTHDALVVAERYPNISVDTSEIPHVRPVRQFVDAIGPERVLFGTDAPYCDPLVELEKVKLAGLTPEEYECVCSKNGLRLLGLNDREGN